MKINKEGFFFAAVKTRWDRAVKFGYFFAAICCLTGLAHIIFLFWGYRDFLAMGIAFGCAALIYAGVWLGKRFDDLRITVWIYFVLLLLFGYYGFGLAGGDGTGAYWCFLQPMIAVYVLGPLYGSVFLIAELLLLGVYFYSPLQTFFWPYTYAEKVFIPMAYIALSGITLFSQWEYWKTEKKQGELLKEAKRADISKSEFLANMSHEIRTPMNAIMGMCEMTLNEELSEEARENVSSALVAGNNLLGIINDILDFSKIDSGKMELIETVYETSSLINDVVSLVESRKKDSALEFMVDCDPNLPGKLMGDEVRIRQILVNLLTNAVKYTREGGVLFTITFRRETYGVNLRFSVKDSGIGIRKENLDKIFSTFSQVDTKKNRAVEGTGLGLPIARRLAESMNGFIRVRSEYGKGSEFVLILPQKVVDEKPMVTLLHRERVRCLCYWNPDKHANAFCRQGYLMVLNHMIARTGLICDICQTRDAFEEKLHSGRRYTHLLMGREEYESAGALALEAQKRMRVVVVQNRFHHALLPSQVVAVYKPFYVVSLVNAVNYGKRGGAVVRGNNDKRFHAPKAKVLIVDDNQMNLRVAMGLMRPYLVQMEAVESGEAAVALLKKSPDFDLIFLDHMMPGMDGVETAALIRSLEGEYYALVPIVALTANAVNGVKERFLANGFQDYLAKPIELNQLDQILKKWLPSEKIERNGEDSI